MTKGAPDTRAETQAATRAETVVVASANPVKRRASAQGFARMFPHQIFELDSVSVPSGVDDQPMTDEETLRGAINRVQAAARARPDAAYWVGLEGGIEDDGDRLHAFAWVVVGTRGPDTALRIGRSRTATFELPDEVAALVRDGMELGAADDVYFGQQNSKHQGGAVGLLTDNVIDRAGLYAPAVVLALIPFRPA